jgi:competence protein ComEC
MRNLALAAGLVILFEPEAIMGASFQLSFAAVAALVAVYEARVAAAARGQEIYPSHGRGAGSMRLMMLREKLDSFLRRGLPGLLFATFCATAATASFMAYNFNELSPYVLIGNPLTLTVIEIFAVPGALIGTLLYPLGLDAFVWRYIGLGIDGVMWAARMIGSWPGSTVHLPAFAPWAIVFLTLGVLSSVLWRTCFSARWQFRLPPLASLGRQRGLPSIWRLRRRGIRWLFARPMISSGSSPAAAILLRPSTGCAPMPMDGLPPRL